MRAMFDKPTNAVELVRCKHWSYYGQTVYWHRLSGRPQNRTWWYLSCKPIQGGPSETVLASPADIRHGFILPLCERCFPGGAR